MCAYQVIYLLVSMFLVGFEFTVRKLSLSLNDAEKTWEVTKDDLNIIELDSFGKTWISWYNITSLISLVKGGLIQDGL